MKLKMLFCESLKKQIKKLLKSYPKKLTKDILITLSKIDPTCDDAKYLKWLAQQYIKGNIDINNDLEITQLAFKLQLFDKQPEKFPNRNIYKLDVNDLLDTIVSSISEIDYSTLLVPPNKLIKEIDNYKFIEINAYQGMEQFKKESKTVPTTWCIAYPDHFDEHGIPQYLIIENDKPYTMVVYQSDELKYTDNSVISLKDFKKFVKLGFIDLNRLEYSDDSMQFALFVQSFDELVNNDNTLALINYIIEYKPPNNIIKIIEQALLRTQYVESIYNYAKQILKHRWKEGEKYFINVCKDVLYKSYKYGDFMYRGYQSYREYVLEFAYRYAIDMMNRQWPALESLLADYAIKRSDDSHIIDYCIRVTRNRSLVYENALIYNEQIDLIRSYLERVLKKRWPEAEDIIMNSYIDKWYIDNYINHHSF